MIEQYYRILGIKTDADEKALKKAFRNLALKLHPDVNNDSNANEKFHELCEAYEIVLQNIRNESSISAGPVSEPADPAEYDAAYEELLREARQKAYERARMRYDKMKAEREFFEESNLRDFMLLFKYAGRILALPLAFFLLIFPVFVAVNHGIQVFFGMFIFWIVGGVLINQVYSNRKKWFRLGKIRWKFQDLVDLFDFKPVDTETKTECFYSKGEKADGKIFNIIILKVKNIVLRNDGVFQHYVSYNRKFKEIIFPRSVKAFKVHLVQSLLKIFSVLVCLIWLPFPSYIWRFAAGLAVGQFLSSLLCSMTRTRSKVSYLLNWFIIIKIVVWMLIVMSQTIVYPGMMLQTTVYAPLFIVFLLILGDVVIDLILRITPFYNKVFIPVIQLSPNVMAFYRNGYQNYLDVPVWSTIYPLARWFI